MLDVRRSMLDVSSLGASRWNGSPRLQECFQVRLRRQLKSQNGFTSVASMGMTAGQQFRLGNPRPVFIAAHLNFGGRNNHDDNTISERFHGVNDSTMFPKACPYSERPSIGEASWSAVTCHRFESPRRSQQQQRGDQSRRLEKRRQVGALQKLAPPELICGRDNVGRVS
jgi:hypothetical protein